MTHTPEILAPAGDTNAFLAAVAAGADAVYLGLKHFSARMQADNFSITDLAAMKELAVSRGVKIYIALNSLLKPGDLPAAGRLIQRLERSVSPDALIVQDLACIELARQVGFSGELHLSTLANVSSPAALSLFPALGVSRVVMPRELNVDELRLMNDSCPVGLNLETFVHGALCFCVSGRCWWSSYMGGKSGLRGRCVQPCRRKYRQKSWENRFFSCQDFSLDVLTKPLLDMDRITAWKIEGRKKGPHYVYYTTTAYKLLRDSPRDPAMKKHAQELLELALGRPSTNYSFLPQNPKSPVADKKNPAVETSSGRLAGKVGSTPSGELFFKPRFPLLSGDIIRIGVEDEPWHATVRVNASIPKNGRFTIKTRSRKPAKPGTPVFLIDRREPELAKILQELNRELNGISRPKPKGSTFKPQLPKPGAKSGRVLRMKVMDRSPQGVESRGHIGLWLGSRSVKTLSKTLVPKVWWWLPPVIWPEEEEHFQRTLAIAFRNGARRFVLGAPWQVVYFREQQGMSLIAGPMCNAANPLALKVMQHLGMERAIAAMELGGEDFIELGRQSPVPIGAVTAGEIPVGISRVKLETAKPLRPLSSPMREVFWYKRYGQNMWIYPNWPLDLTGHEPELEQAGYDTFITMTETRPKEAPDPGRTSSFNWDVGLM